MNKFITYLYSFLDFNRHPDRYDAQQRHNITTMFLLSGLYSIVAVSLLIFFAIQALAIDDSAYAFILLGFAVVTVASYLLLWYLGLYTWASHLVVALMASLCLMLFYTGGESGYGPLWYFVFPVLALFVQGQRGGLISAVVLMVLTLMLATSSLPEITARGYSNDFLQRLVVVYVTITALSYLFAHFRNRMEIQLEETNKQLEKLSKTDKLSGLLNRRGIEASLDYQIQAFNRYKMPFSLVLFDINSFKEVNDTYGHLFGDYVIQAIGQLCLDSLRQIDSASRWGGDEFLLLLPGTSTNGAIILADRLKESIRKTNFSLDGQKALVTISYGISEYKGNETFEKLIANADEALYRAKELVHGKGNMKVVPIA